MATIFQIRRGSGSVSLVDGEIYLHKGIGSLQVASGTTTITLATLDDINSSSIYLSNTLNTLSSSIDARVEALELYSASYAQYFTYSGSKFHIDFNV